MGAQWKNANKSENANKRGALISKLVKEIMVAARIGDPSPDHNARLRAAVEAARKSSVPRDTIERAIKKGAGLLDGAVQYETQTFEGFTPHKIPVIIECLTDNKNRTSSNIKAIFRKGQLGSIGSVTWMFDRLGIIEATHATAGQDLETVAIEAGAQNVEPLESDGAKDGQLGARFFTEVSDIDVVNKALSAQGWTISLSELGYVPKTFPELTEEAKKEVIEFLNEIDDDDDVHRVFTAMK